MEKKLNLIQIFVSTKAFLDIEFFKNFSYDAYLDGLDIVISGFSINKCKENWQLEPGTWDQSVWLDWIRATNEIIAPEVANPAETLVSALQGYQIMKKYIENFANEFEFKDLSILFKRLDIDKGQNFLQSLEYEYWLLCIDSVINNNISIDGSLLSLNDKILSKKQSLQIAKIFLQKNNFLLDENLKKSLNDLIVETIKDNILSNIWIKSYDKFVINNNDKIKVIDAYNITRLALENYFKSNKVKFLEVKKILSVDDKKLPIEYKIWYSWLNSTYSVIFSF